MKIQKATHKNKVTCMCGHSQMVPNNGEKVKCAVCRAYLYFKDVGNNQAQIFGKVLDGNTYPFLENTPHAVRDWRRIKE